MSRAIREFFSRSDHLLPELHALARSHNTHARVPGLKAHTHFHVFEIFYIERGEVEWWTEDECHRVSAGQIYINRPGERHGSSGAALGPFSYFWLQLKADRARFLPHLPVAESQNLFRILSEVTPRCFSASPDIERYFQILLAETRQPGPCSAVVTRANLHLLLAQIARDAGTLSHPSPSPAIRKALRLLDENLENDVCPALLAAHVGLSQGHFRERFRAEMGFTPHAYLTRQRIEAAKVLLREGNHSIADIGRRFGFCSSQHFATVFKKLEGISPSTLKKSAESQTNGLT